MPCVRPVVGQSSVECDMGLRAVVSEGWGVGAISGIPAPNIHTFGVSFTSQDLPCPQLYPALCPSTALGSTDAESSCVFMCL